MSDEYYAHQARQGIPMEPAWEARPITVGELLVAHLREDAREDADLAAQARQIAYMRGLLYRFGGHLPRCVGDVTGSCTCGWQQAAQYAEPPTPEALAHAADIAALQWDNTLLRAALREYGRHSALCMATIGGGACTCGLEAAIGGGG